MHQDIAKKETTLLIIATVLVLGTANIALYALHNTLLQLAVALFASLLLFGIMHRASLGLHEVGLSKKLR